MARGKRTGIYRSKYEAKFASNFPDLLFEPDKIKYTWPARTTTYTPDWKIADNVYGETKGKFDPADRQKLLLIKEQHPDIQVILIFQNPNLKLGKRLGTCTDWANKHGFVSFAGSDVDGLRKWINDRN